MGFMMAIEDLPADAVAKAVRRFIRGEVKRDRHTFLPSAPELAREARDQRDAARAAAMPPKALPPPERRVSDEERAKVDALMADLAKRLGPPPKMQSGSFTYVGDPLAELEALRDVPISPSPNLLHRIGKETAA